MRPGALRGLARHYQKGWVALEGGIELEAGPSTLPGLYQGAGVHWPDPLADVPPGHRPVYEAGLRDWPTELLRWSDEDLRRRYSGSPQQLVDDVVWEAYRRPGGSRDHRGRRGGYEWSTSSGKSRCPLKTVRTSRESSRILYTMR